MFLGTHTQKLDDKGRLILPAKYITDLEAGLILTRGHEHCLYVYTKEDFDAFYQQLKLAPITSRDARDYQRMLLAGATDETPDKQRRITIPPLLRTYANLTSDLTLLGVGERIEIWDTPTWEQHFAETQEAYANREEEVIPGLL